MTAEDREILERINKYANKVSKHDNSKKTRGSDQLEKLKPIMEKIAKEKNLELEDILVKYLDLVSEYPEESKRIFQNTVSNMPESGNPFYVE